MRTRIVLIEDEKDIVELVAYNFRKEGFELESYTRGGEGLEHLRRRPADLLLLDIMLPDLDGFEICRRLRAAERLKTLPVIFLTAKGQEIDRVLGLEMGADDYVVKPFSPRELTARVKSVLRRASNGSLAEAGERPITRGELYIDAGARSVRLKDRAIELTGKEFDLLWFLASNAGQVFTRTQLLDKVWGYEFYGDASTVTVHVRRLREKIEPDPREPRYLTTVWGVGYRFEKDAQ